MNAARPQDLRRRVYLNPLADKLKLQRLRGMNSVNDSDAALATNIIRVARRVRARGKPTQ